MSNTEKPAEDKLFTLGDIPRDVQGPTAHGIPRDEWVRRFKARLVAQLELTGDTDGITEAELESWPERDEQPGGNEDWLTELPEAAADENISNWGCGDGNDDEFRGT